MIGYLTRGEMLDQIIAHTQSPTSKRTVAASWLDSHYYDFATRYRWPQLTKSEEAKVTFAANLAYVYLPPDVDQLYVILDTQQMDSVMTSMSIQALLQQAGAVSQIAGQARQYAPAGEFARRYDFLVGGEQLAVAQTGYTGTTTAYVNGIGGNSPGNPDSYEAGESVTVSATPGVYTNLPSGTTYFDLMSFSVNGNASGTYLLKGVTSGTIYAIIQQGDTTSRYGRIRLNMLPANGPVVTLVWKKRVKRLINDAQTIEIPVAFALIDKTIASLYSAQREYNAAMQYHDGRAEAEVERAFTGTTIEGEKIELGQPTIENRNRRIVIVSPSSGH